MKLARMAIPAAAAAATGTVAPVLTWVRHCSSTSGSSPHELLGVPADATVEELRAAFSAKARECHPDTTRGCAAEAAEQFQRVHAAYEQLRLQTDPLRARGNPARAAAAAAAPQYEPSPLPAADSLFAARGPGGATIINDGGGASAHCTAVGPGWSGQFQ